MRFNTRMERLTLDRWSQAIVTSGKEEHMGAGIESWIEVVVGVYGTSFLVVLFVR